MSGVAKIELAIGYTFRNPKLLEQAFTHKTYARSLNNPEFHNEWLALFGDAILDVVVMEHLFRTQASNAAKGVLSDERDRIVADANLELLAEQIQLRDFLRVIRESGAASQKDVTDGFEALLAAIYLDITSFTTADEALDAVRVWFTDKFLGGYRVVGSLRPAFGHRAVVSEQLPLPELEAAISYSFQNKALLHQAIDTVTPANFHGRHAGLALFGDTLLDLLVLEYLHRHKDNHGKGLLSTLRDLLVRDSTLAVIAHRMDLKKFIVYGGQLGVKNLTDSVEALLAAIYLDRGLLAVRDWIFGHFPPEITSQVEKRLGQELANTQVPIAEMLAQVCLISAAGVNYERLHRRLGEGRWQEADEETKEVMLRAVGSMNYLSKGLIDEFPVEDLEIIDRLWVHYSGGRFGFSVQVGILREVEEDWAAFSERVGWQGQAKGDRIYDLHAPMGHLPSAAIRAAGHGKVRMRILQRFAMCQDRFSDLSEQI